MDSADLENVGLPRWIVSIASHPLSPAKMSDVSGVTRHLLIVGLEDGLGARLAVRTLGNKAGGTRAGLPKCQTPHAAITSDMNFS